MRTVFLVKPEDADIARGMEKKIISLPFSTGVLFAGVSVVPSTEEGGKPLFMVWIGCHRDFDEKLMDPLVRVTLKEEILAGARVVVDAHRGLSRAPLKVVDKDS